MTTEVLQKQMSRYLCGESKPAEARQIQNWLSYNHDKKPAEVSAEEKAKIEKEIVANVKAYIDYSLFMPNKAEPWWKKITAFF